MTMRMTTAVKAPNPAFSLCQKTSLRPIGAELEAYLGRRRIELLDPDEFLGFQWWRNENEY